MKGNEKQPSKLSGFVRTKTLKNLGEKSIRADALVGFKTVEEITEFQVRNEKVCHVGLCDWLKYEALPHFFMKNAFLRGESSIKIG